KLEASFQSPLRISLHYSYLKQFVQSFMRSESRSSIGEEDKVMAMKFVRSTGNLEFYATTKDHSQKRNPCFDPVGAPPRPPRTILMTGLSRKPISSPRRSILQSSKLFVCFQLQKVTLTVCNDLVSLCVGLEVLNLPPDIQEILQHLRMRCRWPKILLATVVKLISLLDKIVTGAQMGVISLIMREIDSLMEYYIEGQAKLKMKIAKGDECD
ncbi:hypothetical protein HID58_017645, partial [Brassica napus]